MYILSDLDFDPKMSQSVQGRPTIRPLIRSGKVWAVARTVDNIIGFPLTEAAPALPSLTASGPHAHHGSGPTEGEVHHLPATRPGYTKANDPNSRPPTHHIGIPSKSIAARILRRCVFSNTVNAKTTRTGI